MTGNFLKTALSLLIAATPLFSCAHRSESMPQERIMPQTRIPGAISSREEASEYLSMKMWNCLEDTSGTWLSDSLHIAGYKTSCIEQALADFCNLVSDLAPSKSEAAAGNLSAKAINLQEDNFRRFSALAESYMYDPNSPLRDEEIYLGFASGLLDCEYLSQEEKDSYEYACRMCSLNRKGTQASDFQFSDNKGRVFNLYGIEAEYILLFFSNPGCQACKDIINSIQDSPDISLMVKDRRIAVVNVYIDDDIEAWMEYQKVYPASWYNGYDFNHIIRDDTLYNIRAIPSLYLLDGEKRVIFKDCPENKIFDFFQNIANLR